MKQSKAVSDLLDVLCGWMAALAQKKKQLSSRDVLAAHADIVWTRESDACTDRGQTGPDSLFSVLSQTGIGTSRTIRFYPSFLPLKIIIPSSCFFFPALSFELLDP